ncbi:hypothetical protein Calab_1137 [Caldithrix abyssi DSM 13497]|uniref:Uncharacterized protein n=1 Tax=Caldithrix abyssi DSM 13497 TaxID=880073 RepID=H1XX28_CALAY|nr:hypothetical protein [Caldithrix abyssi]APF20736.1 hypothetical protein Cabys_3991 [Caldithrix abyssi DSM 13497]EHO40765.1 hypothetical protein Calab_1137 [Caldithrix abyssi DSM 13497]
MARKRSEGFLPTLFPFLSILTCTAGVLSFIIISISVVSLLAPSIMVTSRDTTTKNPKKPTYVECHPNYLLLTQTQDQIPYVQIDQPRSPFRLFLQQIKQRADSTYIVFAIYPEGERTFRRAYRLISELNKQLALQGAKIDIGYEPFNKTWHLQVGRD